MQRKHYTQMIEAERQAVRQAVDRLQITTNGLHLAERMAEKGITVQAIELAVRHGRVIEVTETHRSYRVLLRHEIGLTAYCVVVSLDDGFVVTAWKNRADDNHRTIRMAEYQWQANLIPLFS